VTEPNSGRLAVVTGGSGGIGSAIVRDLAENGYRVAAIVRRPPPAPVADVTYLVADVSDAAGVNQAVEDIVAGLGAIEVLVTTAAVLRSAPIHKTTEAMWDEVIGTNLKGVFLSCRAVLPSMIEAGSGSIINLSSVHAVATIPGTGAYAATKGAIVSLSRQMAVEYADDGIRVNSLIVGSVDTAMTDLHKELLSNDGTELTPPKGRIGRMAQPGEIAKAVRFLASSDSSFVTGSALTIDGGLLSVLM
jgi:NAD(P)-dependent dehydrogenase (short-subunit alcohol dehydrogenase family)